MSTSLEQCLGYDSLYIMCNTRDVHGLDLSMDWIGSDDCYVPIFLFYFFVLSCVTVMAVLLTNLFLMLLINLI